MVAFNNHLIQSLKYKTLVLQCWHRRALAHHYQSIFLNLLKKKITHTKQTMSVQGTPLKIWWNQGSFLLKHHKSFKSTILNYWSWKFFIPCTTVTFTVFHYFTSSIPLSLSPLFSSDWFSISFLQ